MRKSTLFISAALTTFMLAILFGVASAYQNIVGSTQTVAAQPQPTAMEQMVSQPAAPIIPTQALNITPEAAAAVASKVLGRTDLYSVEISQFEGAEAYLVTFSSGDIVYLSLDGQVLSISKLPVTTTVIARHGGGGNDDSNTTSSNTGGGEHEDHEGGSDD
jgi:hypothetical protein